MAAQRGFGIAGGIDPAIARAVAEHAERAGYATFWANDTPRGDGLATLAEAAAVSARIGLGVGVLPLDRQSPATIATRVSDLRLDPRRLLVGVGSGAPQDALARVRDGVATLKQATGVRIIVGALGPRMCALAGEVADGVLLNWLTPEAARESAALVRNSAERTGRPRPYIAAYVRVALGTEARQRLEAEASRYASVPSYARSFARMGVSAVETSIATEEPAEIEELLRAFDFVDEVVVRAIVGVESREAYLALVEAASDRRDQAT